MGQLTGFKAGSDLNEESIKYNSLQVQLLIETGHVSDNTDISIRAYEIYAHTERDFQLADFIKAL